MEQLGPEELTDGADEFGLRSVRCGKFTTLLEEYLRATGDDDSRAEASTDPARPVDEEPLDSFVARE